jgi:EmrB/QacA subfamily drug resistance transporter
MSTTTQSAPAVVDRGYRFRWTVMALVIVADVMDLLDSTVANLAGPSIHADLGGGASTLQWVLAGYTMAFAVGLVTSARLGDRLGRRQMFVAGMIGFTASSLLCGLAPTAHLLIGARVLQGLFGAVMIPQGLAMVKQSFVPEDLQKAFIPFGPVMGLSAVLGPILAGVLLDADIAGTGWRAIFLINVPIGVVASAVAWRFLPDVPRDTEARLDWYGAGMLTVASALLIYPLVQGREQGWPWWCFAMMAAAAVVFAGFVANERRSAHPVVEPSLFGHRGFVAGVVFIMTFFVAMSGLMLTINLFLQLGLGFKPLHTGLALTPWAGGTALGAVLSGAFLGPRFGRRVLHGGLIVVAAGLSWFALVAGNGDGSISGWDLAPALAVCGIGMGLIFAPLFDIVLSDLDDREVGTGSGVLNALQQFGGALGVAVLGTALFSHVTAGGWFEGTRWVAFASVGCLAISFAVAFLLPRRAREDVLA